MPLTGNFYPVHNLPCMTDRQFRQWMQRMGLTIEGAAELLDISRRTVINYRSGVQPVPRSIEYSAKYLEERKEKR
jgi:transcriptional regulator with XRE-family HTH domain